MKYSAEYQIQVQYCKGAGTCSNSIFGIDQSEMLISAINSIKDHTQIVADFAGDAERHHRPFLISLSMCPNACSRPQIADIGLIGALIPKINEARCSGCGSCVRACKEGSIKIESFCKPVINITCLNCGACVSACGTGAIAEAGSGFRIQLGGKLGRHPFLGRELPGIYAPDKTIKIIEFCFYFYLQNLRITGMRFGDYIMEYGITWLPDHLLKNTVNPAKNSAKASVA